MTKYYILELEERNGEYEYSHYIRTFAGDETKAQGVFEDILKGWYEDDDPRYCEHSKGYYFNGDEVFMKVGRHEEIPEHVYHALTIVPEL